MESATAAATPVAPAWTDPKRYLWLLGLIVPLIPFMAWGLVQATGAGAFYWFGPVLVFAIIPALDLLIGKDAANPPDSAIKWLEEDKYYRWCTYLFLPLQFVSFFRPWIGMLIWGWLSLLNPHRDLYGFACTTNLLV